MKDCFGGIGPKITLGFILALFVCTGVDAQKNALGISPGEVYYLGRIDLKRVHPDSVERGAFIGSRQLDEVAVVSPRYSAFRTFKLEEQLQPGRRYCIAARISGPHYPQIIYGSYISIQTSRSLQDTFIQDRIRYSNYPLNWKKVSRPILRVAFSPELQESHLRRPAYLDTEWVSYPYHPVDHLTFIVPPPPGSIPVVNGVVA